MEQNFAIQLFEDRKVRVVWDAEQEKYFFSIVDIIQVLTESENPQTYWRVLKKRLRDEGNESVTNCNALKIPAADGKKRMTDVADIEQLLRLIQSIPSKKAEPVKRWLAEVGSQRIDQMIDPELTFQMAVDDYRRQGYSDRWIENRLKSIRTRNELTNEWKRSGVKEQKDFAILTNILTKAWSGMTTGEYKQYKGLTKENLRDNMTTLELALNTLPKPQPQKYPNIATPSPWMRTNKWHKAVATQPIWLAATSRNKSGIASYPRNVLPTTSSKTQKQH